MSYLKERLLAKLGRPYLILEWISAGQRGHSRGNAYRRRAVRVLEEHSTRGQVIQCRGRIALVPVGAHVQRCQGIDAD